MPTFAQHVTENRCPRSLLRLLQHWVRSSFPYWDRSGGRDHVFFLSSDSGGCAQGGEGERPILLSHWGLLGSKRVMDPRVGWSRDFSSDAQVLGELRQRRWCFSPHKDVVVPAFGGCVSVGGGGGGTGAGGGFGECDTSLSAWFGGGSAGLGGAGEPAATAADVDRPYKYELLHAGGIWSWKNYRAEGQGEQWYSQGVRQELYRRYGGQAGRAAGIKIAKNGISNAEWLDAKFCLAPSGMGWGLRTSALAMLGCVPFVFQPFVMQPFEDLLPYHTFSARADHFDNISQLPSLLSGFGPRKLRSARLALRQVRRAFSWEPTGLAYNYTIAALCFRALELRGRLKSGAGATCASAALPVQPRRRLPEWFPPSVTRATRLLQRERRAQCKAAEAADDDRRHATKRTLPSTRSHLRESNAMAASPLASPLASSLASPLASSLASSPTPLVASATSGALQFRNLLPAH